MIIVQENTWKKHLILGNVQFCSLPGDNTVFHGSAPACAKPLIVMTDVFHCFPLDADEEKMVSSFPGLFFSNILSFAGPLYIVVLSNTTGNGWAQQDYAVGSWSYSQ